MQDDAIRTTRIYPAVHPGITGMKCSYGKISSPRIEISGTESAPPLIWKQRQFQPRPGKSPGDEVAKILKDLEAMRDLGTEPAGLIWHV